jgi:hypothetical protein
VYANSLIRLCDLLYGFVDVSAGGSADPTEVAALKAALATTEQRAVQDLSTYLFIYYYYYYNYYYYYYYLHSQSIK